MQKPISDINLEINLKEKELKKETVMLLIVL
jgi:hypothetical protein